MAAGAGPDPAGSPPPVITDEVRDAAATAYYSWVMGRSEAARQRAQVAFTMVSFIVGAIVAAGLFGGVDEEDVWVQILGVATLSAWLVCAGLLLKTAVGEVFADLEDPAEKQRTIIGRREFVQHIIEEQERERNVTYARLNRAVMAAAVAMLLTAVAIGSATLDEPALVEGEFVLTAKAIDALPVQCRRRALPTLAGSFAQSDLAGEFVEIKVDRGECRGVAPVVQLPRGEILAVRE